MPAKSKRCGRCGATKPMGEFARDRSRSDGRMGRCKTCDRKRNQYDSTARKRPVAVVRLCPCGQPATSQRHRYCDACRPIQTGRGIPGRTVANGYGPAHQRLRRQWAPKVATGTVACARCKELIPANTEWDLGHDDLDRSKYTGPEHQSCNRNVWRHRRERAAASS